MSTKILNKHCRNQNIHTLNKYTVYIACIHCNTNLRGGLFIIAAVIFHTHSLALHLFILRRRVVERAKRQQEGILKVIRNEQDNYI